MTPVFSISVDGAETGPALHDRLLSMTITDRAGLESDELVLSFDDREPRIAPPERGALIRPAIGWINPPSSSEAVGQVNMGVFAVDRVSASSPPDELRITCKPADMGAALKEPRTKGWEPPSSSEAVGQEKLSLGNIVRTIAHRHVLKPAVDDDMGLRTFDHISQTEESDLHFLTRLGRAAGGQVKVADGWLILAPRGKGKATTGEALPMVEIAGSDLARWSWQAEERSNYLSVRAFWQDIEAAERKPVIAGPSSSSEAVGQQQKEGPQFTLRRTYASEAEAQVAATGKLKTLKRGKATITGTLAIGNPEMLAEGRLHITGLRPEADGLWSLTTATHRLEQGGYTTEFEAETPE